MLVLRKRDGKIISVSRQKVRIYESAYTGPLNERMIANKIESEFVANDMTSSHGNDDEISKESTVYDGKTVLAIRKEPEAHFSSHKVYRDQDLALGVSMVVDTIFLSG